MPKPDYYHTTKLTDMVRAGNTDGALKMLYEWVKTGHASMRFYNDIIKEIISIESRNNDAEFVVAENE